MSHLYHSNLTIKKSRKLNYFSSNLWRAIYLISTNQVYHTREKKIYSRGTTLPNIFIGYEVLIYSGKKWHRRKVNQWMVGFKSGEFTWNRRFALYKAKQLRKKKKKISMKFEHILQIYWTKGFFYGGKLFYVDQTFKELFLQTPGLGQAVEEKFKYRFELDFFLQNRQNELLLNYQKTNFTPLNKPINIIYSQINSVNNQRQELYRLRLIHLYLIKSYRGRCHALGKPVRGQRTWSNAWNSYNLNTTLRSFISETKRAIQKTKKEEKINYKIVKKKYASKSKNKKILKKKQIIWF